MKAQLGWATLHHHHGQEVWKPFTLEWLQICNGFFGTASHGPSLAVPRDVLQDSLGTCSKTSPGEDTHRGGEEAHKHPLTCKMEPRCSL